ncbi:hypothetical protein EPN87_01385 [archaeon]|nr:MAG: hypothetical protein EPN87_01385 [archaeon]
MLATDYATKSDSFPTDKLFQDKIKLLGNLDYRQITELLGANEGVSPAVKMACKHYSIIIEESTFEQKASKLKIMPSHLILYMNSLAPYIKAIRDLDMTEIEAYFNDPAIVGVTAVNCPGYQDLITCPSLKQVETYQKKSKSASVDREEVTIVNQSVELPEFDSPIVEKDVIVPKKKDVLPHKKIREKTPYKSQVPRAEELFDMSKVPTEITLTVEEERFLRTMPNKTMTLRSETNHMKELGIVSSIDYYLLRNRLMDKGVPISYA